jgi:uncharacterized protein YcgI (DUF1989 family)
VGPREVSRGIEIPPRDARAFLVRRGESARIVDIEGGQPGDLVAFCADDMAERFSQSRTRVENRSCRITEGHLLWTNGVPPRVMFSVSRDTGGRHDLLYTPCNRYALEKRFGVSRDGCQENLARALERWGVGVRDVPDPLNLFFAVEIDASGRIAIGSHRSKAGAFIELEARLDALVAVSTCSVPLPGKENTGFLVEIAEA